jgi:hypothetical protein
VRLPAAEVERFYRLYFAVLCYANQQYGLAPQVTTIPQIMAMPQEEQYALRQGVYAHREVMATFVQANPAQCSDEDLGIVASWRHFVQGQFYVLRHLKSYTIFLDAAEVPKAYGVLALHDDFPMMFPRVPFLIDTVLLPFQGQIVYDGQCQYYNIVFGGGITRRLNDSYQLAKTQSGIITTLPFESPQAAPREEEQLRFYVRSERNREMYEEEIMALRQQSLPLETLYQQEMGRVHARTYSPRLRDMGLHGVWFAILEGVTIVSGRTRQEVEQALQRIVPTSKLPFVYTFEVKDPAQRRGTRRASTT